MTTDEPDKTPIVGRAAIGAACAIFDADGRALLVHHTYGRLNWELPGGLLLPNEAPNETALREVLEETGLQAELERLTGVYFEPDHMFGPMLHFVFRARVSAAVAPTASSPEVSEVGFWRLDALPVPISDFTERRLRDASSDVAAVVSRVGVRRWRE